MGRRQTDPIKRFWDKVEVKGPDDCWPWLAYRDKDGYGGFAPCHKTMPAHRFAWTIDNGPIPIGKWVLHTCDNPSCVNLKHLWLGTATDNNRDATQKGHNNFKENPGCFSRGEKNGKAILKEADVLYIREQCVHGDRGKQTEMAKRFGVSFNCIWGVTSRKNWRHI